MSESRVSCSPIVADSFADHGAHLPADTHIVCSPVVGEIRELWRMRQRWHRAEKSLVLQGKAFCRSATAGDKTAAGELFKHAQKGEQVAPDIATCLEPFLGAVGLFNPRRKQIEKQLKKLAESLPQHPWVLACKGFGTSNFAYLVGEAGDITNYRNPSCLWKRMGLAVINGERQRKHKDADLAELHGYSPSRRAVAYLIGESLIKAKSRYRSVYDDRRAHTAITHPDWTPKHSHNDGLRIMTKRVLRDLWIESRRVTT